LKSPEKMRRTTTWEEEESVEEPVEQTKLEAGAR
jgi:hypothetical protein